MNNFLLLLFLGALLYNFYLKAIHPFIVRGKHKTDKVGIPLTEEFDNITLAERLRERGFTYPEMKNIRHNELGEVVIEGKFTSHALEIKNNVLFVGRGEQGSDEKEVKSIMEAVVIGHYLSKFFNPYAPVDAYREFVKFRSRRKHPLIVTIIMAISFAGFILYNVGDEVIPQVSSNSISASYLTQYNSDVTIGDAFHNFFGNPKWKSYEIGIQKYVDFQGTLLMDNESAVAVVTFSINGESFKLEAVKINNEELNALEVAQFFNVVYNQD